MNLKDQKLRVRSTQLNSGLVNIICEITLENCCSKVPTTNNFKGRTSPACKHQRSLRIRSYRNAIARFKNYCPKVWVLLRDSRTRSVDTCRKRSVWNKWKPRTADVRPLVCCDRFTFRRSLSFKSTYLLRRVIAKAHLGSIPSSRNTSKGDDDCDKLL